MKASRRSILIVARTGLLGLAGAALLVASHMGDETLSGKARQQTRQGTHEANGRRQNNAARNRQASGKQHLHHDGKKDSGSTREQQKGIRLKTGSLLPAKLVSEDAGTFSAHMLLPFETFPSEAELAEAIAEAEKLNLFILPR